MQDMHEYFVVPGRISIYLSSNRYIAILALSGVRGGVIEGVTAVRRIKRQKLVKGNYERKWKKWNGNGKEMERKWKVNRKEMKRKRKGN